MIRARYWIIITALCSLLLSTVAHARTLADAAAARKLADQFMAQLVKGEADAGYDMLSAYIGVDFEQFNQRGKKMLGDLQQIGSSVGKPIGFDLLATQSVKTHFMKLTYLLIYGNAALVWELNFYQPEKGWQLVDVSYHANINDLFQLNTSASP